MTILLVDDAAFMRSYLKEIVTKAGHTVVAEAQNGAQALEQYLLHTPDLVFMDITMPEVDGITAVKNIIAKDPNAKIVMCSAMGQQLMVVEAIQSGAKDFIIKPCQPGRILEAIARI